MQLGERAGLKPAKRMREVFGDAILDLCRENERVVILDGDLSSTTRTHDVRQEFPDRFFNTGIAESNMISMASGLASCGFIPFATSLSSFILANGYDQLRISVAIASVNVKVVGSHGGITLGKDGATAMAAEDLALVGCLPTFGILVPCDPASMHKAVRAAAEYVGPVYLRSSRVAMPHIYPENDCPFEIGIANIVREGSDLTIIGCGLMVAAALCSGDVGRGRNPDACPGYAHHQAYGHRGHHGCCQGDRRDRNRRGAPSPRGYGQQYCTCCSRFPPRADAFRRTC